MTESRAREELTEQDWTKLRDGAKNPRRDDGMFLYVKETKSWGRTTRSLVAAACLKDAKAMYGWTRGRYETIYMHRASVAEVEVFPDWAVPAIVVSADDTSSPSVDVVPDLS